MTIEKLEQYYLTPRYWLNRCVLPTGIILIAILVVFSWLLQDRFGANEVSVLVAFFAFYILVIRGGHIFMIRSMHDELKTDFKARYPESLQRLPDQMKIKEIGFALARIKAELHRRNK